MSCHSAYLPARPNKRNAAPAISRRARDAAAHRPVVMAASSISSHGVRRNYLSCWCGRRWRMSLRLPEIARVIVASGGCRAWPIANRRLKLAPIVPVATSHREAGITRISLAGRCPVMKAVYIILSFRVYRLLHGVNSSRMYDRIERESRKGHEMGEKATASHRREITANRRRE